MFRDPMDSLSDQSSVHGDDAKPLNFGFDFSQNDQSGGVHNASQPGFTLPSMYERIPERSAPTAAPSASPASNKLRRVYVVGLVGVRPRWLE